MLYHSILIWLLELPHCITILFLLALKLWLTQGSHLQLANRYVLDELAFRIKCISTLVLIHQRCRVFWLMRALLKYMFQLSWITRCNLHLHNHWLAIGTILLLVNRYARIFNTLLMKMIIIQESPLMMTYLVVFFLLVYQRITML